MKVNKVSQNYQKVSTVVNKKTARPAFTGAPVMRNLLKQQTAINIMEKLKWFDGEQGRILLTAIGTGAIAPLFIAWNPYVKAKPNATEEEKKDMERTKKYTAMRQPISATLQILFQLSVLGPIFAFWDNQFNNPNIAKKNWLYVDQSALQSKSYVTRQVKKQIKQEEKAGKLSFTDKKARQAEIDKRVKAHMDTQLAKVADDLKASGKINLNGRLVEDQVGAKFVNKTIDDYIKVVKELQIQTADDLHGYKNRARMLCDNEKEIKELMTEALSHKGNVKGFLKSKLASVSNEDVKTIVNEIIKRWDEDSRASRCQRTIDRIETIKRACGGKFDADKYYDSMVADNKYLSNILDKLESLKIKDGNAVNAEEVKRILGELAETCQYEKNSRASRIFQNLSTFCAKGSKEAEKILVKICKDVTKNYRGSIDKRFKFLKEVWGISIGMLVTTPITCTALNWVYPRFMEIFMPNLVGGKKAKAAEAKGGEK